MTSKLSRSRIIDDHANRYGDALRHFVEIAPPGLRSREVAAGRPSGADVVDHRFAGGRGAHGHVVAERLLPTGKRLGFHEHRGSHLAMSAGVRRDGTPSREPCPLI